MIGRVALGLSNERSDHGGLSSSYKSRALYWHKKNPVTSKFPTELLGVSTRTINDIILSKKYVLLVRTLLSRASSLIWSGMLALLSVSHPDITSLYSRLSGGLWIQILSSLRWDQSVLQFPMLTTMWNLESYPQRSRSKFQWKLSNCQTIHWLWNKHNMRLFGSW